jgi:hypothetical protein
MATITLALDDNKKLDGVSQADKRRWVNYKFRVANLGDSCIVFEWREPRSGPFHRRHFKMLASIFEAQDVFDDPRMFRKWSEVSAGYAKFIPMPTGEMCAIPDSIAYERLDQQEFHEIHEKVFQFLRSEHARKFLWSHMSDGVSEQMIETILQGFE